MADQIDDTPFEAPSDLWTYRARPYYYSSYELGVLDGDTYELVVDKGFHDRSMMRIRAMYIDTAEVNVSRDSEEYKIGKKQTEFVRDWILDAIEFADGADGVPSEWPLLIRTYQEKGGFGRWLAEPFNWKGESLEAEVINEYGEEYLYD